MQNKINYRLGNIIDNWYSKEYNNKKLFDFNFMINVNNNNTFGKFLQYNPPKHLNNLPSSHLLSCVNWYWIYDYNAIKEVYPDFNNSLRHAIDDYFTQQEILEKLPLINASTNICVIYLETSSYIIDIDILLHTITTFSSKPDHFEILTDYMSESEIESEIESESDSTNESESDSTNESDTENKDKIYINTIKNKLILLYPNAKINIISSISVDEDFYRMVNAKMLLTGTGSLSIAAAAANIHERRTPEFKNINTNNDINNINKSLNIYENWYTYII